jgi:hypothetical protein
LIGKCRLRGDKVCRSSSRPANAGVHATAEMHQAIAILRMTDLELPVDFLANARLQPLRQARVVGERGVAADRAKRPVQRFPLAALAKLLRVRCGAMPVNLLGAVGIPDVWPW